MPTTDAAQRTDTDAAERTGYVAGFGLGALRKLRMPSPSAGMYTPWTNYLPAWVAEADQRSGDPTQPYTTRFRAGFRAGRDAARAMEV